METQEYALLQKVEQEILSRYSEAMNYLKITPDNSRIINSNVLFKKAKLFRDWNPMIYHKLHELRLGLLSVEMMNSLGIKDDYTRQEIFAGFSIHDNGKYALMGPGRIIDTNKPFTEREQWMIDIHTWTLPELTSKELGNNVWYMQVNHHRYQKKSRAYPEESDVPYTPERDLLTRVLAIFDNRDALTRQNSRTEKDGAKKGEFLSWKKIRENLEEEYGELKLEYQGNKLPKINTTGLEFIKIMYEEGIFREPTLPSWATPLKIIAPKKVHQMELELRLNPFTQSELRLK